MQRRKTKEPQYNMLFEVEKKYGRSSLGLMVNESWNQDPKRTLFTLARYKFVAKMLVGKTKVLEANAESEEARTEWITSIKSVFKDPLSPRFSGSPKASKTSENVEDSSFSW